MIQVRLDADVEQLVRDYAEANDVSLAQAANRIIRRQVVTARASTTAMQRALVHTSRRRR